MLRIPYLYRALGASPTPPSCFILASPLVENAAPPTKKEKKEQNKTQKAGMHREYSIEKWNILFPLCK